MHVATLGTGSPGAGYNQFDTPQGVAVDARGKIYVADSRNHRIQIFDVNGKVLTTFGSEGTDAGQFKFPR